jgi:integrase
LRIQAILLLCCFIPLPSFAGHGYGHHSYRSHSTRSGHHGRYHRSTAAKNAFTREHPCPATGLSRGRCPGYVIDHVNPLECGGADAPYNMQWQTVADGKAKAVEVERWLRGLDLANGTKAKIRNHMSALFSHAIRHELYTKLNPIKSVRQSAVRECDPDILTIKEIEATLAAIEPPAIRIMVMVAATTAIRRSELRGLRWADVDFEGLKLNLRRGLFRKEETRMKSKASRKGQPILPELVEALLQWRTETPYPADTNWIFASPFTEGKRPYWAESAMTDHIRPAATQAGVKKHIGWHTFRHSLASIVAQNGGDLKVVQELLRHATARITMEVYQQASHDAKRAALTPFSGIFVVPKKAS